MKRELGRFAPYLAPDVDAMLFLKNQINKIGLTENISCVFLATDMIFNINFSLVCKVFKNRYKTRPKILKQSFHVLNQSPVI